MGRFPFRLLTSFLFSLLNHHHVPVLAREDHFLVAIAIDVGHVRVNFRIIKVPLRLPIAVRQYT